MWLVWVIKVQMMDMPTHGQTSQKSPAAKSLGMMAKSGYSRTKKEGAIERASWVLETLVCQRAISVSGGAHA